MAATGLRPVVAIYSTFLQRAYDQIFHDVALQHLPVVFAVDRAGLVGEDGETHQGVYDLAYLHTIPGWIFMRHPARRNWQPSWRWHWRQTVRQRCAIPGAR